MARGAWLFRLFRPTPAEAAISRLVERVTDNTRAVEELTATLHEMQLKCEKMGDGDHE